MDNLTELLNTHYGLSESVLSPMEGYDSTNYRVENASGKWVVPILF